MSLPQTIMTPEGGQDLPRVMPLGRRVAHDANAAAVAAAVAAVWRDADAALRPIIGQRGVVALFNRSIHLTAAAHPWLGSGRQGLATEVDLGALEALFCQQDRDAAMSGGNGLLLAFHQLLGSLIGPSLTERLLLPAWNPTGGEPPILDSTS